METKNSLGMDSCKMKGSGYCPRPVEMASEFLSRKWTTSIIITIGNFGKLRFNELREKLENAGAKILSERLRELAKEGIIKRVSYNEIPPRVEYSLTKNGKRLMESFFSLVVWAEQRKQR